MCNVTEIYTIDICIRIHAKTEITEKRKNKKTETKRKKNKLRRRKKATKQKREKRQLKQQQKKTSLACLLDFKALNCVEKKFFKV